MVGDDPGGDDIEIDLTDVYALEGGLNFFKMILHWLDAYHYDCNFNDFEAEDFDIEDYISSHPEIAVLTSRGNEQMSWAKTCLLTAADFFQKAVKNYEQEDDDQMDDLFFIEEEDILTIKNRLGELVDALSGPCDIIIDNDEQEKIKVNLASFFDNPVPDFRILVPRFDEEGDIIYGTFPDPTYERDVSRIHPDGHMESGFRGFLKFFL